MPFLIDDEWARRLPKMWRWMRNFRIEGAGVSAKNTDETFTASITSQPATTQRSATVAIVKITGNASGTGKYNARILTGKSTSNPATGLFMPEGMTVPAADNALFLNLPEHSLAGHSLATDSFAIGLEVGVTSEVTPRKIIVGSSFSFAC